MRNGGSVENVSEIVVDPRPGGLRAVFLVETASASEARDVGRFFDELGTYVQVRQLSKGSLLSFAIQTADSDQSILEEVRMALAARCGFVCLHSSFDSLIYRIVSELCVDTGSKLVPIPKCNICGKVDPFPETTISLSDGDGARVISRNYCSTCTAQAAATNNRDFVLSLLSADRRDFSALREQKLVRSPSRKRKIKFRVEHARA